MKNCNVISHRGANQVAPQNTIEAFEKSILCHCKYKGITNSDAAKLLGVSRSDYEMLLSGKIEHLQKMDRKAVLTALGISQEECSDIYFVNLLNKIEYQEIKNVFLHSRTTRFN